MVHSGPLQAAVSGGAPALVLQLLFFAGVGIVVAGRVRAEPDGRQRLLGAAFLAAGDRLFGAGPLGLAARRLTTLAYAARRASGSPGAWEAGLAPIREGRWPLALLAAAVGAGAAWMSFDTWQRIRAERLMYEAQMLNVQGSWNTVEQKVRSALEASPDKAWASDAAARIYGRRALNAGDRRAYERGVALSRAARAANPFDPYIRLRRAELDLDAMGRGLLTGVTDEGRDALDAAKSMTPDSALVRKVETALMRRGGRILWIEPQASAGFGPAGSLVVAGSAPGALAGTHVFLHWRDATRERRGRRVTTLPCRTPKAAGTTRYRTRSRGIATRSMRRARRGRIGPCFYAGTGSIQLCSPLAMIGPRPAGADPAGSLFVGGTAPDAAAAADLFLHWRNATRPSAWVVRPFRSTGAVEGVSFPADAPGNWYAVIANARPGERYQAYIASRTAMREPCTYAGDGRPRLCSPIAWIQPQATAGFGPPGSLVVAGSLPKERAGASVFLHWRNVTAGSAWTTEAFAPTPDARGDWSNAIPNANPFARYEVSITAPTAASNRCTYAGDGTRNVCP